VKPIVYHCEADVELVGAAKRYKCQSEGLGKRFLHAVHIALAKIQDNPERFPFHDEEIRSCRVMGFPYRVVYEVLSDAVYIIAVAHASRESNYWKNRLS
jgi:toxin ParE1/3/4